MEILLCLALIFLITGGRCTLTLLLDDTKEYERVWDKVYEKLKFRSSGSYKEQGHSMTGALPFEIEGNFAVYGIENMSDSQLDAMEGMIRDVFISVAEKGRRMYALDWQHSAFLFDPRNEEEQKDIWKKDHRYFDGGYHAYFPAFYPDGDYYFFIDEFFEYGYLGHPWRQEIWVFGDALIEKMDGIYQALGWEKIR